MSVRLLSVIAAAAVMTATTGYGQTPASATGACKDGSYTSAETKRGACAGHGGVKEWYGNANTPGAKNREKSEPAAAAPSASTPGRAQSGTTAAGATGRCQDGSYTSADTKRGACSGHGGVKDWYAGEESPATSSKAPAAAGGSTGSATSTEKPRATSEGRTAAAGGSSAKVWVNTSTKVYHCSGDQWYGKTKKGEYMSEAEAKAKGNHPDHG